MVDKNNKESLNNKELNQDKINETLKDKDKKIESLNKEISLLNDKIIENNDYLLRTKAEIQNIKKRFNNDLDNTKKIIIKEIIEFFIEIKDDLETTLKIEMKNINIIKKGLYLIVKKLNNLLRSKNIIEINPEIGSIFNPDKHQAISVIKTKDKKSNLITSVFRKGYLLSKMLLRPALVIVSK